MRMTRRSLMIAVGSTLSLAASSPSWAQTKEIRIGALIAASGPTAFIGASQKNAFEMLVEQINARGGIEGHQIKAILYDTEGNSTLAGQQFQRLVQSDNVHVVIGPSTTGESLALRPLANELKVPLISFAGAEVVTNPPTPYVFKTPPTDRIVAEHMLGFMKDKNIKSIGILSSADGYGQAGASTVKQVAEQLGVKVVAAEEFGPRDSDMTPQLLKIRGSGAEALLIWSVNPGPTIILRNAASIGFNKPIFNSYGAASNQLIQQAGAAAEKTYVSSMRLLAPESLSADDPMREVVTRLAKDYKDRFKADATTFVAHPYDAMVLIEKAVQKAGGKVDREEIAKAIRSGISFPGANGLFRFTEQNHNGLDGSSQSMVMLQVQGGRFTVAK